MHEVLFPKWFDEKLLSEFGLKKFNGVHAGDPGLEVEYHHDVGILEGWVIMTRMKR